MKLSQTWVNPLIQLLYLSCTVSLKIEKSFATPHREVKRQSKLQSSTRRSGLVTELRTLLQGGYFPRRMHPAHSVIQCCPVGLSSTHSVITLCPQDVFLWTLALLMWFKATGLMSYWSAVCGDVLQDTQSCQGCHIYGKWTCECIGIWETPQLSVSLFPLVKYCQTLVHWLICKHQYLSNWPREWKR